MKASLFDYRLPKELIAFHPPLQRDGGRLLVLNQTSGETTHAKIADLAEFLPQNALVVANDTRVIPARLRGRRSTGGSVEVLLVRMVEDNGKSCVWTALARANKPLRQSDRIDLNGIQAEVVDRAERGQVTLRIEADQAALDRHIESAGEVPLPPYIKRKPIPQDKDRYQTVFARHRGSIAAPTAGLHLTTDLIDRIKAKANDVVFVTLHVGPGTFTPIIADDLADHHMGEEQYIITSETAFAVQKAKAQGLPVIAVGTTVVRALESMYASRGKIEACDDFADIFIKPGFEFRVIDGLLTNFHLPRSTLLSLVSALAGRERILSTYEEAVEKKYRFYSYGDAMLILP